MMPLVPFALMVHCDSSLAINPLAMDCVLSLIIHSLVRRTFLNICNEPESSRLLGVFVLHYDAVLQLSISFEELSELLEGHVMRKPAHEYFLAR
jgi:hypothetical protein